MDTSFSARMRLASDVDEECRRILLIRVPNGQIRQGTLAEDMTGIDYQITTPSGKTINVDMKIRDHDFGHDICIEYISSIEDFRIGWTVDQSKVTDYVIWYWRDSRRWLAYDFRQLRQVTRSNAFAWLSAKNFKQIENHTTLATKPDYHSRAVCVPEAVIDTMLEATFGSVRKWSGVLD